MKSIIFVLEIKESRGLGHWYRCLELSDQLKSKVQGLKIIWLLDCINPYFEKELNKRSINFKVGDYKKVESIIKEIYFEKASTIIFDLMEIEKEYVIEINRFIKTITIGGSGLGLSYSNISINGMFKREGFIDKFYGEKLYLGEEYIIFRTEIYEQYRERVHKSNIEKVLISLGADYEGKGIELAKKLKSKYQNLEIDVLSRSERVECEEYDFRVFKYMDNPCQLFKEADICISAGGMTAFEASYFGLPLLLVPVTEFQIHACKKFQDIGLGFYIGLYNEQVGDRLIDGFNLIKDLKTRRNINYRRNNIFKNDSRDIVSKIIVEELEKSC